MKNDIEKQLNEFIKQFNKDFKTKIPEDKKRFLVELYADFISVNSNAKSQREYRKRLEHIENQIEPTLDNEQQILFNKFDTTKDDMWEINVEQAFVYGYCVCELLNKFNITDN